MTDQPQPIILTNVSEIKFFPQYFSTLEKMRPVIIPECERCLGILIFSKTQNTKKPYYSVIAGHFAPSGNRKQYSLNTKKIHRILKSLCNIGGITFAPYFIFVAGGVINTPENKIFYKYSLNYYIEPLYRLFPDVQITTQKATNNIFETSIYLKIGGEIQTEHVQLPEITFW